ncbi:DUF6037 family protein [Irregularibacter muris]|uniref:DUF6037 family protein n=1 Tax=Irregularibacter muris TaxID=1796619 RepID=A0AAE3HI14_9FIRM|nr:DUF6037 family protein [Irregularibacter muris]MCR1899814.1 DUF6037 family protein [Irregularibacter muris]
MALENLKSLKDDMVSKNWTICSFIFSYKATEYIVLVKRFVGAEKRVDTYALVKLHFMKADDLEDDLQVEANCRGLLIDSKGLRKYFGIEYKENLGDILRQFTERLGKVIPLSVPDNISPSEKTAMARSLSKSDSKDPNMIYCTKVKRNSNGGKRSEFNADKTKLLRASLFEYFRNDIGISFCYSNDRSKENDDATVLKNFGNNNSK